MLLERTELRRSMQESYSENPEGYTTDNFEYPEVLKKIRELDPQAHLKVLVIGCGPAKDAEMLKEMGFNEIVAIDNAPGAVSFAQEQHKYSNCISVIEMEMNDIAKNFQEGEFDLIFSQYALFHDFKENLPATIEGIARTLKPGGFVYITTQESPTGQPYETDSKRHDDKNNLYVNAETNETLQYLFENAGINIFFVGTRLPNDGEHKYFKLSLGGQKGEALSK